MLLRQLSITNFRNLSTLILDLGPTTLLLGDNAQGKTNLLEAIYFLATTKSMRAEKESQLIRDGQEVLRVEGEVVESQGEESTKLEIAMQQVEGQLLKRTRVNGIPRRSVDYIGNLVVVYFGPEDIELVFGSPGIRRWHLDLTLAGVDKDYKRAITIYSEALTSRNRILKRIREGMARTDELDFWNDQIVTQGAIVFMKRGEFFDFLAGTYKGLGLFEYRYHPNLLSAERLADYAAREIAAATTLIGPHRDDFDFCLAGKNLAFFGSRGEQRTAVLQLKLAELSYMTQNLGITPVLVLDDVFSELDDTHREKLVEVSLAQQTVISAVQNERIPELLLKKARKFSVEDGILTPLF